ncbi:MAG: class II glutamine amidotransferase [Thermoplasmata archaeon]|nr:class II glutamine amidotransferase [Thermoplasmata archaeon]
MCRLFGLLGSPVEPAEPWLIGTDRSLLAQSNIHPSMHQADGWGIAWYPSTRTPHVEKGVAGAYEPRERERFVRASKTAMGPVVLGHLRHASNPLNLPRERLIGLENSQPFVHGGILFAHNGSIEMPREARALLGKFEGHVRGVNDSEILFWLLVKHTEEIGDPLGAYARTVADLERLWAENGRPTEGPYTGLNVLFTRGPNELWAFCYWRGEHGPSFCDPGRPYYEMAYTADAKHIVIGSEPFDSTRKDWRNLSSGHYLVANASGGLVGVKTGPIPGLAPAPRAASPS